MNIKIKVEGFININVEHLCYVSEDVKQAWVNEFTDWVKEAQSELSPPEYDDTTVYIEDIDFLVVD